MIPAPCRAVEAIPANASPRVDAAHPLAMGLVLCVLPHPGALWYDRSGKGNHGTPSGTNKPAWGANGPSFDGAGAGANACRMDFGASASLRPASAVTVIARVRSGQRIGGTSRLVGVTTAGDADPYLSYGIVRNANNDNYQAAVATGVGAYTYLNIGAVAQDVWGHLAFAWNGSTLTTYLNGCPVNSASRSGSLYYNGGEFIVGGDPEYTYDNTQNWLGNVASVAVYNRALGAAEIAWDFREPYAYVPRAWTPALARR